MTQRTEGMDNLGQASSGPAQSFFGLGIAPKILDILERIKFKVPTPIQIKAIPLGIQGKDIVGIAQTGTGKTHSFAIPMIQRLAQGKGTGLVLAPTRELAMQIDESFQPIARAFGMHTVCLIGGAPMQPQVQGLRRNPRVIIGTPGRIIDHIWQGNMLTDGIIMLVLDEADRMLDMGFAPQIEQILRCLPRERQTMLFSATMPKEIMEIAAKYMKLPVSVEIAPSGTTAERVTQELFIVRKEAKLKLLEKLLQQYHGAVLLFSRTKHNARKIARSLRDMGQRAAEIHSDRSLSQRREALEGFKSGKYRVLVATDIAARGIDVTGIELVVNFDLPDDAENYVHRIGRTARAGHQGHAISFATPDQSQDVRDIERLIRATLPISKHPEVPTEQFSQYSQRPPMRPFRRNFNKSGQGHRGYAHKKSFNKYSRGPQ
ncbi:MAG: DEAD/DEAH box helicase [Candidatus Omnitrophica bacterium]|nr:DEAD/DEAH box helicase [Candidatus Omnitrophota bacterium]